jgi:hypothetical protein
VTAVTSSNRGANQYASRDDSREAIMSFKLDTQHLDCGDVGNHDAREKNAVGGAMAWLAFYAMAAVIGVLSNAHRAADILVAALN